MSIYFYFSSWPLRLFCVLKSDLLKFVLKFYCNFPAETTNSYSYCVQQANSNRNEYTPSIAGSSWQRNSFESGRRKYDSVGKLFVKTKD